MKSNNSSKSSYWVLGIVIWSIAALFFLYEFFLRTFVGSVAHQIIPDLGLNAETFSIIGSAYYVAYAFMQIPVGILADKFGVKINLLFATLICALATWYFANATDFITAFIGRIAMGFGSSFAFVNLLIITITWFPPKYFGFFAGLSQLVGTMGPLLAAGPLIALMKGLDETWRAALTQIAVFGLILAILVLFFVKNKPRDSSLNLIFLSSKEPLKVRMLKLIRNQQALFIALYSAAVYVPIALMGAIWGVDYLQACGLSQAYAANVISISWLGYAIGCPMLGAISDLTKRRKPILLLSALLGVFSTSIILYIHLSNMPWLYIILFFCLGLAAAGQNLGFATIAEHVDFSTRATALGLNNASITLFSAIIPPIASYFIYQAVGNNIAKATPADFAAGLSVMPFLYLLAGLIALTLIKETFCKAQLDTIKLSLT